MKEIGANKNEKHFILVIRKKMSGKNTFVYIWSFKRKRDPDGGLIKHKYRLCAHESMEQCGVNYWETYFPVANCMSVRAMLTLIILG